jgi:hypothetical protein
MLVEGVRGSQQWRSEQDRRTSITESIQIFQPMSPEHDAQVVIRMSSRATWDILCKMGLVQSA